MNTWLSFLAEEGAQLVDGIAISFGERPEDYPVLDRQATILPITDRGLIQLTGADNDKLLQGQLTCDMRQLNVGGSQPGALCDNKGRMISNVVVSRPREDTVLMSLPAELISITIDTLKKFAVFYKTDISDVSQDYCVLGLSGGPTELPAETETLSVNHLVSTSLRLLALEKNRAESLWKQLRTDYSKAGLHYWEYLNITAGIGEVRKETTGEFIPQMLNLQHVGAVSFRKGCYTGQEIVARMQYRGKLKRRMYCLHTELSNTPPPGTTVFLPGNQEAGSILLARECAGAAPSQVVLAILTEEAAASGRLIIGETETATRILPLPYDHLFAEGQS